MDLHEVYIGSYVHNANGFRMLYIGKSSVLIAEYLYKKMGIVLDVTATRIEVTMDQWAYITTNMGALYTHEIARNMIDDMRTILKAYEVVYAVNAPAFKKQDASVTMPMCYALHSSYYVLHNSHQETCIVIDGSCKEFQNLMNGCKFFPYLDWSVVHDIPKCIFEQSDHFDKHHVEEMFLSVYNNRTMTYKRAQSIYNDFRRLYC